MQLGITSGDVDLRLAVFSAGLQQQDLMLGVSRQSIGEDTPCGARADDDMSELSH
jgi:hypothetical protein